MLFQSIIKVKSCEIIAIYFPATKQKVVSNCHKWIVECGWWEMTIPTSPVLRMLFMSSKNCSIFNCVSLNRNTVGLLSAPDFFNTSCIKSAHQIKWIQNTKQVGWRSITKQSILRLPSFTKFFLHIYGVMYLCESGSQCACHHFIYASEVTKSCNL